AGGPDDGRARAGPRRLPDGPRRRQSLRVRAIQRAAVDLPDAVLSRLEVGPGGRRGEVRGASLPARGGDRDDRGRREPDRRPEGHGAREHGHDDAVRPRGRRRGRAGDAATVTNVGTKKRQEFSTSRQWCGGKARGLSVVRELVFWTSVHTRQL